MYNTQEDLNIQENGRENLTFFSFRSIACIPNSWYRQLHVLCVFHSKLHVGTEMGIKIYRDHFHGIYNNLVKMPSMHEAHKTHTEEIISVCTCQSTCLRQHMAPCVEFYHEHIAVTRDVCFDNLKQLIKHNIPYFRF